MPISWVMTTVDIHYEIHPSISRALFSKMFPSIPNPQTAKQFLPGDTGSLPFLSSRVYSDTNAPTWTEDSERQSRRPPQRRQTRPPRGRPRRSRRTSPPPAGSTTLDATLRASRTRPSQDRARRARRCASLRPNSRIFRYPECQNYQTNFRPSDTGTLHSLSHSPALVTCEVTGAAEERQGAKQGGRGCAGGRCRE